MRTLQHVTTIRSLAFLTLLATLIAAPFGSQARPRHLSGISGQVLLHNGLVANLGRRSALICPFPASLRVYSAATGEFIAAVTTDPVGRFQVALAPGDYRVVPNTIHFGQVVEPGQAVIGHYEEASPVNVTVRARRFSKLTIIYEEYMGN